MATESENQKGFIADHTDNEIEREETTVDDPQEGACGCPQINSESKGGGKESGHVSKTAGVDAKLPNDTDFDKLGTRVKEAEESESQRKSRDNFVRNPELKPESNIDIKHKDSATHDDHSSNENEDKSDEPVGIMSEEEKEVNNYVYINCSFIFLL